MSEPGVSWSKLRPKLLGMQRADVPVKTPVLGIPNKILEVGDDYVVVKSSRGRHPRKILAQEIENGDVERYIGKRRIIVALRKLADDPL